MSNNFKNNICYDCSFQDSSYCNYCEVEIYNDINNDDKPETFESVDVRELECFTPIKFNFWPYLLLVYFILVYAIFLICKN